MSGYVDKTKVLVMSIFKLCSLFMSDNSYVATENTAVPDGRQGRVALGHLQATFCCFGALETSTNGWEHIVLRFWGDEQ